MWPTVGRRRPELGDDDDAGAQRVTGRESPSSTLPRSVPPRRVPLRLRAELADVAVPFLLDGLAAGEAAVVATGTGDGGRAPRRRGRRPARARPRAARRLPRPHARPPSPPSAGWPSEYAAAGITGSAWSARSTSGRPSATGSSGSATRPSSTRPSRPGRCGVCASSTPSGCPIRCSSPPLRTHTGLVTTDRTRGQPALRRPRRRTSAACRSPLSRSRDTSRDSRPRRRRLRRSPARGRRRARDRGRVRATCSTTSCSPSTR